MNIIDTLINDLAQVETAPDAFNLYAGDAPNNVLRRDNLRRYLLDMQAKQSQALMVMEAPGYRGCRLTGIPVTSRAVIAEHDFFKTGYQHSSDAGFEDIRGEQSATIVWNTLSDLGRLPLIWNTFPFHPHKPDQPRSNRRPRKPETRQGAAFLERIITLYQPRQIIAIGNVAHETLTTLNVPVTKVRHPAQGGKNDFVAGLTALLTPD